MTPRRALLVVAVIGAVLLTWAASRFARQFEERPGEDHVAADAGESGERATLRFFRNPAPAPAFTVRDLLRMDLLRVNYLAHAPDELAQAVDKGDSRAFGRALLRKIDRRYGIEGLHLARADADRTGVVKWEVRAG